MGGQLALSRPAKQRAPLHSLAARLSEKRNHSALNVNDMSRIFVSSTYQDLADHRQTLNQVLLRMKQDLSAMEFFGSRADEATPACLKEIDGCDLIVGIYAWRYGWVPPNEKRSITEIEFDHARQRGKRCLCYVVSEHHPWLPTYMEAGTASDSLRRFKEKINALVRSQFTTPDDLAKQVAADVGRELAARTPTNSVGDLLSKNWDRFAPELQDVLMLAFAQAQRDAEDGIVATRHVLTALAATANTSGSLLQPMLQKHPDKQLIDPLRPQLQTPSALQVFQHDKPFSGCVLGSLERLLPAHSPAQRLMAVELAADLLKHGRGNSVLKFRQAGIDGMAVERALHQPSLAVRAARSQRSYVCRRAWSVLWH